MASDIELLQDIYKFDIKHLIQSINSANFLKYFNLINDLLKLDTIDETSKQELCDKLVQMCLELLFKANAQASIEILNLLKISIQFISLKYFHTLLNYYSYYLIQYVHLNDDTNCKLNINPLVASIDEQFKQPFSLNHVHILNSFLSILMLHLSNSFEQKANDESRVIIDFLIDYCLSLLDHTNSTNLIKLCINTLESIIKLSESYRHSILSKYFQTIQFVYYGLFASLKSDKKRLESHLEDTNIYFLASISDYYIIANGQQANNFYLFKHEYWYLVQNSLVHTNALTRKRGLYLLKRIIDFSNVNRLDLRANDACAGNVDIFDSSLNVWNDYFLCIEMFEETSIHIIKPCLQRVDNILAAVRDGKFHFTWLLTLLHRAFLHESKFMVRWALQYFYKANLFENTKVHYDSEYFFKHLNRFLYGPLMLVLQEAYVYYRVDGMPYVEKCPVLATDLTEFLNSFTNSLLTIEQKANFVENFTTVILSHTWNSTCLLFIAKALYELKLNDGHLIITSRVIRNIITIIEQRLGTHEILIRSSIQTFFVKTLLKHLHPTDIDESQLTSLFDFINTLSTDESFKYLDSTWCLIVNWFQKADKNSLESYSTILADNFNVYLNSTQIEVNEACGVKLAKLLLIFTDVNESITNKLMMSLMDRLLTLNKYIYTPNHKTDKILCIFNFMLKFVTNRVDQQQSTKCYQITMKVYNEGVFEVLDYLFRKATDTTDQAVMFSNLKHYTQLLETCLRVNGELSVNNNRMVIKKILKDYLSVILSSIVESEKYPKLSTKWKLYTLLTFFSVFLHSNYKNEICEELLLKMKTNTNYVEVLFKMQIPKKTELLASQNEFQVDMDEALVKYSDYIDLASYYSFDSLIKSCRQFQIRICSDERFFKYHEGFVEVLRKVAKSIWDIYGDTRSFENCYVALLDTVFVFECAKHEPFIQFLLEFMDDVIVKGREKNGIVKPMVDRLINLLKKLDSQLNANFSQTIVNLIVFGDVYKKEKRCFKDVEVYIESLGQAFTTNQHIKAEYLHDFGVRVCIIDYLITEAKLDTGFFDGLIRNTIDKDGELIRENQKQFVNSLLHRERFRLWQYILVLLQRFNKTQLGVILAYCEDLLVTEHQPSNRILLEWIFIKSYLLIKPNYLDLFKHSNNFATRKVGYTCSWLSILTHLAPFVEMSNRIEYFKRLIALTLSQLLSSAFHIRIYCESTLIKLYTMFNNLTQPNGLNGAEFRANAEIQSLMSIIYSISKQVIDDNERHANLILSHFYFQFNPETDYTVQTIFNTFPRLCGIIEDEHIELETYICLVTNKPLYEVNMSLLYPIRLQSQASNLEKCQVGLWRFTPLKDETNYEPAVNIEDLQKKITPWHTLMPMQQDLELVVKNTRKPNQLDELNTPGLVLVASLIDKGTNLGGLCRTCEIFNVKEFVIGSLKYIEDKQFQSLAVTAQKWLNIKEVPVKFLKPFLIEMKLRGYTLVGVEQTANSVQLNEYKFPPKCLLLLGNEKEGISVELIQLLDVCVEIPQLGIIRSLNVHVSAAITIWEYTKQHLNKLSD